MRGDSAFAAGGVCRGSDALDCPSSAGIAGNEPEAVDDAGRDHGEGGDASGVLGDEYTWVDC